LNQKSVKSNYAIVLLTQKRQIKTGLAFSEWKHACKAVLTY